MPGRRNDITRVLLPFMFHLSDRKRDENLEVLGPLYFGSDGPRGHAGHKFGLAPIFFGNYHADGNVIDDIFSAAVFRQAQDRLHAHHPARRIQNRRTGQTRSGRPSLRTRRDPNVRRSGELPLFYFMRDSIPRVPGAKHGLRSSSTRAAHDGR